MEAFEKIEGRVKLRGIFPPSCPGLTRLRGRSRFGEAKARASTSFRVLGATRMAGTSPVMTPGADGTHYAAPAPPGMNSLSFQLLIDDLDRAVDLATGHVKLMRDQLHQEVDALDERRTARHCTRRR
jgi:hypothetical protein